MSAVLTVEERPAQDVFLGSTTEWDALAAHTGGPFLTAAWLRAWTAAFAPRAMCLLARDPGGTLVATACVRPSRLHGLEAAANVESGEWTVCGVDHSARQVLWQQIAQRGAAHIALTALPAAHASTAREVLRDAGYRIAEREVLSSPRLSLPATGQELLQGVSHNLRSQYRRRTRALQEHGRVSFRTGSGAEVERDLATFLRLEASGWKSRRGSAVVCDERTTALYCDFARAAAGGGWLRMQFLEVDGQPVAADLSCSFAGGVFMVKTAYDERLGDLSPGLVLRGWALEAAVDEGFAFYDFLGGAEPYKLRWGATPRTHVTLLAYRGPLSGVACGFHERVRPRLKQARDVLLTAARPPRARRR